jgi:two-component system response regulator NreC
MNTIKLLIAEDHTIVRQGLSDILEKYEDICIVAEAEDGISMMKKYFEFGPHVVLSDIEMPGLDGLKAAEEILAKDKGAKIIFLTMYNTDDYVYHAYKMGAFGLISKSVLKNELVKAIRTVAKGQKYFMNKSDTDLAGLSAQTKPEQGRGATGQDSDQLTPRDKAILELIAEGMKSEEIGKKLCLSKRTIDVDRSKIMAKLNLKTSTHLVLYAVQHHLKKK